MSAIKIISSIGLVLFGPVCLLAQAGSGIAPDTYSYSLFFSSKLILGLLATGFGLLFLLEWKEKRRIKHQLSCIAAENQLLKQAKQELVHSNEVAMHDLKSPLRTISSFVSLFLRKYGKDLATDGREYLSFVQNAGQQLYQLIDEAQSEAATDSSAWVDAGQVLQETLQQLNYDIQQAQAKIEISGTPFPQVNVLKGQLSRLFQNLIANGIKFTASGVSPVIMINYETSAQWHTFSVADQGIGIPPEDQQLVFGRYQRSNTVSAYEGSGLGLTSCQQIVDQLGGRIWLTSQPGKGSTFYFQIPRTDTPMRRFDPTTDTQKSSTKLTNQLRAAVF